MRFTVGRAFTYNTQIDCVTRMCLVDRLERRDEERLAVVDTGKRRPCNLSRWSVLFSFRDLCTRPLWKM